MSTRPRRPAPATPAPGKVALPDLVAQKSTGVPIVMITAYDAPSGQAAAEAGVDVILVGDSAAMTVLGHDSTMPITIDEMIVLTAAATRGSSKAERAPLVVADMPFMSYQPSLELALRNAGRLLADGGAQAVKVEGAGGVIATTRALVEAGVPVVGHLGLTPQSIHTLGGFRVQGRSEQAAARLIEDALALEEAGAFALVLETIPAELAANITERLAIPTIGIGAGVGCDGQVLVSYDLLGLFDRISPKFVKQYANLGDATRDAVRAYVGEVKARTFPTEAHAFK